MKSIRYHFNYVGDNSHNVIRDLFEFDIGFDFLKRHLRYSKCMRGIDFLGYSM